MASVSADDSGPLEIRVYCSRQRTLLTSQGQRSPFLSFFLPFTGKEDWSEDSVLAFTCTEILQRLTSWAPAFATDITVSQIAHCIGRVKWENGLCRYVLPVLFGFADSWSPTSETLHWPVKRISKVLRCPAHYVQRWFDHVRDFRPGGDILLLPPDSGRLDPPDSRPDAKRQRSQRV